MVKTIHTATECDTKIERNEVAENPNIVRKLGAECGPKCNSHNEIYDIGTEHIILQSLSYSQKRLFCKPTILEEIKTTGPIL